VTESLPKSATPAKLHEHAFDVIQKHGFLNGDLALQLLNASLVLHTGSPTIEAKYQYYREEIAPKASSVLDCDVWATWRDKYVCSPDELVKLMGLSKEKDGHWKMAPHTAA
jgi:UDP-glucose:glycoprotein glucosyltransferase